jgi:hypothetical protein
MPTVTRDYESPDTAAQAARHLENMEETTTDLVGEKLDWSNDTAPLAPGSLIGVMNRARQIRIDDALIGAITDIILFIVEITHQ